MRSCGAPLERREQNYLCPRGHSFDVARTGYVNLLQPQDRRSRVAGDSKTAIDARARLFATGVGRDIANRFVEQAASRVLHEHSVVVDLGCGSGDALALLAQSRAITGIGIDLSTAAIDRAARTYAALTWVVANADRRLPLLDRSVDLVLSLHARRNPSECARVLARSGSLLVAVPAHDDLIELRELVQGEALHRERADALVAEHENVFTLVDQFTHRVQHDLEREALIDVLRGTYRGARLSASPRVSALDRLTVTFASEFFCFTPVRKLSRRVRH